MTMPKPGQPLTEQQEKFALEYLVDLNARQAAIRAGYSEKTAASQASRLLTNVNIQKLISEGRKKLAHKTEITVERILTEYARIAFMDIRDAYTEDGKLKPIQDMPKDVAAAISGIDFEAMFEGSGEDKTRVGDLVKIRLSDKTKALDSLSRHLGMFNDQLFVRGLIGHTRLPDAEAYANMTTEDLARELDAEIQGKVEGDGSA